MKYFAPIFISIALLTACGNAERTFTQDEWRKNLSELNGKSQEEVFKVLGKPCCGHNSSNTAMGPLDVYEYRDAVKDPSTGKGSRTATIVFTNGKLDGKAGSVGFF